MVQKILDQIASCAEPALLKRRIENAIRQGNMTVERAARLRLYEILPSATPGTLEYDVWQSIYALEDLESTKKGKTIRLQRTRTMIRDKKEAGTVTHLVMKKTASAGFHMLLEYEIPSFTFEALVLKHPDQFDGAVRRAAQTRLKEAGVDINRLFGAE
jgi:hypothetical protein